MDEQNGDTELEYDEWQDERRVIGNVVTGDA